MDIAYLIMLHQAFAEAGYDWRSLHVYYLITDHLFTEMRDDGI